MSTRPLVGRATIADIAARAGVSKSTVSHALSGKRTISEATQRRIRAVIDELGYRPSVVAQRLAGGGHSRNIGLVFPLATSLMAGTEAHFVVNAANVAHKADYAFLLLTHLEGNLAQFERVMESGLVDGFILMKVHMQDRRVELLRREQIPFVLLGRCAVNDQLAFVDVDIARGVTEALTHLTQLGHRKIAYLPFVDDGDFGFAARTLSSFQTFCREMNVESWIRPCKPTVAGVEAIVEELLAEAEMPSAVLVRNVTVAEGLFRAARRHQLAIPEQLSIIAMGSASEQHLPLPDVPMLTLIDIHADLLATTATQILLEQLEGRNGNISQQLIAPHLLVGRSSQAISSFVKSDRQVT